MEDKFEKIIKQGYWSYNGKKMDIYILIQNWDYFYEEGYDKEPPDLNEEGLAYYVIFGGFDELKKSNRSSTCLSINEAITLAEAKIYSTICWNIV